MSDKLIRTSRVVIVAFLEELTKEETTQRRHASKLTMAYPDSEDMR
jgi:cell division inhibitor SulA